MTHEEIVGEVAKALAMVLLPFPSEPPANVVKACRPFARAALAVAGRVCREEAAQAETGVCDSDAVGYLRSERYSAIALTCRRLADRFAPPTTEPTP